MADVIYQIDNVDFSAYDVFVSASSGFGDSPKPKQGLSVNWKDHNGDFVDLSHNTYDKRELTIDCFISATGQVEFIKKANAFLSKWRESGLHVLRVILDDTPSGSLFYFVHLDGNVTIKRNWNEYKTLGTFQLKLIEPDPMKIIISNHMNTTLTITGNASRLWKYWQYSNGAWQYNQIGGINISFTANTQDWLVLVANSADITGLQVKKGGQDVTTDSIVWENV